MKCREVEYWIYSFRPNTSWPADLVDHLRECEECQRLRTRLQQIDQEVHQLANSLPSPAGKASILDQIEHTPQQLMPTNKPSRGPGWPWVRRGAFLTGAAALLLFGWLLGQSNAPPESVKTVEVFRDKIIAVNSMAERHLLTSLIKRNVLLVQASQAKERLDILLEMANDCRQHALTLLEEGPRDHLPLAIDLYGKLLQEGVLVQLQRAPEETRPALTKTVRTRLEQMAESPAALAQGLPKALEDQQNALQKATQQMIDQINRSEQAPAIAQPVRYRRSDAIHPTAALVLFAITVSNESEQLVRAEFCAECIQQLMPSVVLCLADDTNPQQTELGQQFGALIRCGVYTPLAEVKASDPSPQTTEKASRILEKTSQAVEVIERNWQQARPHERVGLERALEATKKGWAKKGWDTKGWEKGVGKGKKDWAGKGKKGKSEQAPGHLKKASLTPRYPQGADASCWVRREPVLKYWVYGTVMVRGMEPRAA